MERNSTADTKEPLLIKSNKGSNELTEIAIFFISKNINKKWLIYMFWISWVVLFLTILNHSFPFINLPNYFIYIPAFLIIALHFYNLQFCKCQNSTCCSDS